MKSPVLENCTPGSVRGALGNQRPYLAKMRQIALRILTTDGHGFYRRQQSQRRRATNDGDVGGNILTAESAETAAAQDLQDFSGRGPGGLFSHFLYLRPWNSALSLRISATIFAL